jgi:pimeloyl-ACP methyl ester carboxylesterase
MPGPKSTPQQVAALKRDNVAANAGVPMLSYLHAGSETDPRVIYIHGTPGEADGWADFLVDPVPGLEAVAVDRPGFGESGARDGSATDFEMQARAIAPLLVERQGKWPIVVGHSLGGPIAARLAAMYPDRVGGLVIVAGSLDPEQEKPGIGQEIATTGFVRFFLPQTLDNSMGELSAAKKQTQLLAPELKNVTCPVIVIHGTTDELVPYDNVAYIRKMLVNAGSLQVVTLEGQGHFIPWERPDTIRQAVKDLAEKQR